ncbi:DMT family transporter [Stappia stellulata]|uniref:DMT family transporter n=1 Tax=Stappia stellulata TaxID=71235 RepID=UPI0004218604|nr:DMT family transporter [Stappia stellulata]
MRRPDTKIGILLALVCLALLAVMPVLSNARDLRMEALVFAFALSVWQVVFAVPLFAGEMIGTRKGVFAASWAPRRRRRALVIALATGAMFGLSTYLYVLGAEKAGSVNLAIAIQVYPLFAIAWETIFLGRRKTALELLITSVLLATLVFLATGGTFRPSGLSLWFLVALGVPFLWSVAHVIIREELTQTPVTPAQVTFFRVAISTVFLALMLVAGGGFDGGVARALFASHAIVLGLVYYLELIVWFHAVRHIDVSLASSITAPWPAVTMVLAAVFLGEAVAPYQVVSFVLIVACIYGLTLASLKRGRQSAA